jgi:uncharacterized protein (TIGR00661 family)
MAKIIYGVSGEGSGHSSRAKEIAGHLVGQGHDVRLASYDRGYRNLAEDFNVMEIEGLHIASEDNEVSKVKTFTENIKKLPEGHKKLNELRHTLFKEFQPDAVITDFEPMTAYLANFYDFPLITIDNQHRMRYMRYSCPDFLDKDRKVTETVIRAMVPKPDISLVTTFFFGEVKNERTFLFPPILREEVLALEATKGDYILVYLTSGFDSFLETLKPFEREKFIVYGYDREDSEGQLQFKSFSKQGFLDDLASCKAVMATAGFTLMTESLYLKKPYLAMPMNGQFEQELNGMWLDDLGYGKNVRDISSEAVGDFLYRVPEYMANVNAYDAQDNSAIENKLDELLANDGQLIHAFHKNRK